jgi:hypothetical protein
MERVGERVIEDGKRRDREERELDKRLCMLEERMADREKERKSDERRSEERIKEIELTLKESNTDSGKREERMQLLELRISKEEEGVRKVNATLIALTGRVNVLVKAKEDREGQDREFIDERLETERAVRERLSVIEEALEDLRETVKEKEESRRLESEITREEERREEMVETGRLTAGEREERERTLEGKISRIEERLERERNDRIRLDEDRKKMESVKEMECKVTSAMENVKILNLRFQKVSEEKIKLLKEAEGIIKGKVGQKDRKECEWILRKSKVYILGKGTKEKKVEEERFCTAPVLVKCGSQVERERLDRMLKANGVATSFHWPKEMLEFVDKIRGEVEQMGYRKEEYFVKMRPYKGEGAPQLRAEVKRMVGRGVSFERVGSWSCPPAERSLW